MNSSVVQPIPEDEVDACQELCIYPEPMLAGQRTREKPETSGRVASLFGVLANPTRLLVVYVLLQAPYPHPLCGCDPWASLPGDGEEDGGATSKNHYFSHTTSHSVAQKDTGEYF